jgi:Arc/MetJ-type ribon-helix-helix transcriptional regulator
MKVSVSLPDEDVKFLDAYAVEADLGSRSAALHRAVRLLQVSRLGEDYAAAWEEWAAGDDAELWATTIADGLEG